MPRIFDNIEAQLLPALRQTLEVANRSDFCVGYFNLRGWRSIDDMIERWPGGAEQQCRLLVGMQQTPHDDLRAAYSLVGHPDEMSNQQAIVRKRELAKQFRDQLTYGVPTEADEFGLRRLSAQLKAGKLVVKLFLRHSLHAKLYLCFRTDPVSPVIGYLGSSNLTMAGLSKQGELNVDVVDHDAAQKLALWFNDRWDDRWCIDITKELIAVIDESWARPEPLPPYWIYVKMAYHLASEARAGLSEFDIPPDIRGSLLEFQAAAVRIAARHLHKRGGVILGDVVGLGKTIMATALARVFQDPPHSLETLILCPKNLVGMWESYAHRFRLLAKVVSITQVQTVLPELRRYRVLILDESHNLRNREGKRWAFIHDYIQRNACKCILLSATPYNKEYLDLSNQLRLFLDPESTIGLRPEEYLRSECGGRPEEFTRKHQCAVNTLAAFEKSVHADDWRDLMRLFMVRRTRSFVEKNYAFTECPACGTILSTRQTNCPSCEKAKAKTDRPFLILEGDRRFYFPKRRPKTVAFAVSDKDPDDQYARLYSDQVVHTIAGLDLPRYGLGNYLKPSTDNPPTPCEADLMSNLSRAGQRLIGFCRTNLFKRLESSGYAFLLSVRRHILRNFVYLYALEHDQPLPVGTQDAELFRSPDRDDQPDLFDFDEDMPPSSIVEILAAEAERVYCRLRQEYANRFDWLASGLFMDKLAAHLREDADALLSVMTYSGEWRPENDSKLANLRELLTQTHPRKKILIFSQFADTVNYLESQLKDEVPHLAAVTGNTEDPATYACRFSPVSNGVEAEISSRNQLRVLIATDVLSEGQNLQDAAIIVNYDLPWAIIRLIQRAGRVDRIGQQASEILCYSFLPADGVERLLRLRSRVRQRLKENAEVVGTDETFFEDEKHDDLLRDLFTEKSGILDEPEDNEVDLASYAWQIWKNASDADPYLRKAIPDLPNVVYSTRQPTDHPLAKTGSLAPRSVNGVMVYVRTAEGNDALGWIDEHGETVTESQYEILKAAACEPSTPALARLPKHHELVKQAVEGIQAEHFTGGGQLGKPSSARRRVYDRLKQYALNVRDTLFESRDLLDAIDAIYAQPLTQATRDHLNRELRVGIDDDKLVDLVLALHGEDKLCVPREEAAAHEPRIICSLGLRKE